MRTSVLSRILVQVFFVTLFGVGTAQAADVYNIDPDHTVVLFKANHLGFSNTYGQFNKVEGTFTVDETKPEKSKIELTIDTASVDSNSQKRDEHLRGPDFFNAKQNPKITFKSSKVKKVSDSSWEVEGKLALNGVTKTITIPFERFKTGEDPWKNVRTGGEAKFMIKRSDYKMNYMIPQISDEIELVVALEGIKKK